MGARSRRVRGSRTRVAAWSGVALLGLAAAGAAAFVFVWPQATLAAGPDGLPRLSVSGVGTHLAAVDLVDARGQHVAVDVSGGVVRPRALLQPGQTVHVHAVVTRPGWLAWLVGRTQTLDLALRTPASVLRAHYLRVAAGAPVRVAFRTPVQRVRIRLHGQWRSFVLPRPRAVVALGATASGADVAGVAEVAAAPRAWVALPAPERVAWFPRGAQAAAVVRPVLGKAISPLQQIRITLSEPVAGVFAQEKPRLAPAASGSWSAPDDHTLVFTPTGFGLPLGGRVTVRLPQSVAVPGLGVTRSLRWQVAGGSLLRLQQLLASLRYLPLRWTPAAQDPVTPAAEVDAALSPPAGGFAWRFKAPEPLKALWQPGVYDQVTRGAVMRFEDASGLAVDGLVGPRVWEALLQAAVAGKANTGGYSYVLVHRSVPQKLVLWHDGKVAVTTLVNTGVPGAPTQLGTFAVYLRLPVQTMSGTNPDGSHYSDPGIRWISYFNGGDAIHGFQRASYGYPQSVGCVELPVQTAAAVWPLTPIGTLVTIAQ